MIRLFKLVFVIVIIAGAFFSFQQHSATLVPSTKWPFVTTQNNAQIQFPDKPEHTQRIRNLPGIGEVNLQIYQHQAENELFVYIEMHTASKKFNTFDLNDLEPTVFALNDTNNLAISHKRHYDHQGHATLDYVAHDQKGNIIYCRTIKQAQRLISIIYVSPLNHFSKKRHKQFFNAVHW